MRLVDLELQALSHSLRCVYRSSYKFLNKTHNEWTMLRMLQEMGNFLEKIFVSSSVLFLVLISLKLIT